MSAMRGGFPDTQTLSMQQEALRRVREMQERTRHRVEETNIQAAFVESPQSAAPPPPATGYAQETTFSVPNPIQGPAAAAASFEANGPQGPRGAAPFAQNQQRNGQNMGQGVPNILSQLFGGGAQRRYSSGSGFSGRGQPSQGPATAQRAGYSYPTGGQQSHHPSGLLDLLRSKGLTESFGGLGETLHNTISSVSEPLTGLLDTFGIDGETLVILLVMWVIFNERGDKTLLLALGYLLL